MTRFYTFARFFCMFPPHLQKTLSKLKAPYVGVDEAGRGCLAGPVCAGAVILNNLEDFNKLQDSKVLSPLKRRVLFTEICQKHQVGIGSASAEEIDKINILQASLLAMRRAVLSLKVSKASLLIDGKHIIPNLKYFTQIPVIKGDSLIPCISAASIIAKHFRDEWMKKLDLQYPGYGFEKHYGYPTNSHKKALLKRGPSFIHRKTFRGVKELAFFESNQGPGM